LLQFGHFVNYLLIFILSFIESSFRESCLKMVDVRALVIDLKLLLGDRLREKILFLDYLAHGLLELNFLNT